MTCANAAQSVTTSDSMQIHIPQSEFTQSHFNHITAYRILCNRPVYIYKRRQHDKIGIAVPELYSQKTCNRC